MENTESARRTVAWFKDVGQAHEAVLSLERHGIDSTYIEISHTPTVTERRAADRNSFGWLAKLGAIGLLVGAVIGGVVGVIVALIINANQLTFISSVITGVIVGAALFGLGVYAVKMPVQAESYDMLSGENDGDDWVAVYGPIDLREKAKDVLEQMEPVRLVEAS